VENYLKFLLPSSEKYMERMADQHKERYAAKRDLWTNSPGDRRPAQWLMEHLPAGAHHVLDIGTGRGRDLVPFLEAGHRATGLDLARPVGGLVSSPAPRGLRRLPRQGA
jgi:SAM-dependent methyltransferase